MCIYHSLSLQSTLSVHKASTHQKKRRANGQGRARPPATIHLSNQLPVYTCICFRHCLQYLLGGPRPQCSLSKTASAGEIPNKYIKQVVYIAVGGTSRLGASLGGVETPPREAPTPPKDAPKTPRDPPRDTPKTSQGPPRDSKGLPKDPPEHISFNQ